MSTFTDHPAFQADRPRERRVESLKDIYAVLPYHAGEVVSRVWDAMQRDEDAPSALRALEGMTPEARAHVLAMSRAIAR